MAKARIIVDIDTELHRAIKGKIYAEGRTIKDVVVELLKGWLKQKSSSSNVEQL